MFICFKERTIPFRMLGDYYVNIVKKNVDMSAVDANAIGKRRRIILT